jgi:tRNA U34 5-methylaminomethyl-2-thiouridine-forming methyltransferase MnmC
MSIMMSILAYSKINTDDGSTSYLNHQFNESYHSQIGAYTEALEKHVRACKIEDLVKSGHLTKIALLDVCFGLGYNSGVAVEKIWTVNPNFSIEVIGLENDPSILEQIASLEVPEHYKAFRDLLSKLKTNKRGMMQWTLDTDSLSIKVLINDARESIKELSDNYFDAVFFDPFSPKVCPELWTKEFISDVVSKAKPGAYISTYSSSRLAKDAFAAATCTLSEGPKLNRRNGGVLAQKR